MTSENIAVDNVKRNLADEVSDQDDKDVTQNSLTKKVISLRKTHMSTQNESTLLNYRNNASTPNTLKCTRNVSTDAAPIAATCNEGTSSLLHHHTYLHIAETEKENRKLKAEVSDLKLQLDNERSRRVQVEQIWHSQKELLDEERWKFENERNDWEKERKRLLMDRDKLADELKKLHQHERHDEHDNDNESQDDNSWNIISLTSGEESEFKTVI